MPTYDYVCDACAHRFEHFQGISEPHLLACPACRRRKLRRLIGAGSGVVFKGSGFYETDYKRSTTGGKTAPVADASTGAASVPPAKDMAAKDTAASPDSASKAKGPEAKSARTTGADEKRPEARRDGAKKAAPRSPDGSGSTPDGKSA